MASLKELGVECSYNPNKPKKLHYSISIEPDRLKYLEKTREYFTQIINAVTKDASKKRGLKHLTISVNKGYLGNLRSITQDLLSKAKKHKKSRIKQNNNPREVFGGAILGGLVGLVLGYGPSTEVATNIAEYMNNASYLLAPVTGLIQAGTSILGTGFCGFLGFGITSNGLLPLSEYYTNLKTPLASRVKAYKSLAHALFLAESNTKQTA